MGKHRPHPPSEQCQHRGTPSGTTTLANYLYFKPFKGLLMKNKAMAIYLGLAGLLTGTPAYGITDADMDRVLSAIRVVESNNNPNAVGDSGKAIGVYQIWDSYWKDATEFSGIGGTYKDCFKADYADKVVRAYMKRYATKKRLGREVTMEDIARLHNGGPRAVWAKGKKKQNLDKYWAKVQKELNR